MAHMGVWVTPKPLKLGRYDKRHTVDDHRTILMFGVGVSTALSVFGRLQIDAWAPAEECDFAGGIKLLVGLRV